MVVVRMETTFIQYVYQPTPESRQPLDTNTGGNYMYFCLFVFAKIFILSLTLYPFVGLIMKILHLSVLVASRLSILGLLTTQTSFVMLQT